MPKSILTDKHLLETGFTRAGSWTLADNCLTRSGQFPSCAGVYAFVKRGQAMYVGLASGNVSKRLYFYARPGATQRTNLRLNDLIRSSLADTTIDIFVACPPDFSWNGLCVRGAAGLEAGIIGAFELPWNQRGQSAAASGGSLIQPAPVAPLLISPDSGALSLLERVEKAIAERPRSTEAEIAKSVFGRVGYQQKVNPACRALLREGRVRRSGIGGARDPFVYIITA